MAFNKNVLIAPCPATARGVSTKLSIGNAKGEQVVYTNGKTVIIRDLKNPALSVSYSGHVNNTTVARISPSGYYCASADVNGIVKVWDTVGTDQVVKGEYRVLGGRINDVAWDGESKRIIAVGDGRDKLGHAFMMDTGSSAGEIFGNNKAINAVSIRQQRPYRAATGGDDALIIFYHGVPFKSNKMIKTHAKFVQDVQYAPSGDVFASVGSDYKMFLYDGTTGDTLSEVTDSRHKGSIMACSWSEDSKSLITSSADCTVKLWDVETRKATTTWTLGTGIVHQQMGNTWTSAQSFVSLSLSGYLNIFDPRIGTLPSRVILSAQKPITAISLVTNVSNTFLAGTADGRVFAYNTQEASAALVQGEGHSSIVTGLAADPVDGKVYSIGYDDRVREIEAGNSFLRATFSTKTQPKNITVAGDATLFVVEVGIVECVRSNQKVSEYKPAYTPSAVTANGNFIAIGGEDSKVHLHEWNGRELVETVSLEGNRGTVTVVSFSPDGTMVAAGDSTGRVCLFNSRECKLISSRWASHSARINSLSWTANSQHLASGALDTHIFIWSVARPLDILPLRNAGPGGVNGVLWVREGLLASVGADACVRLWEVKL